MPSSLGKLVGVTGMDLSSNALEGDLPSTLSSLSSLLYFDASYNLLSGGADVVGAFTSITRNLILTHNLLRGTVPSTLGQLTGAWSVARQPCGCGKCLSVWALPGSTCCPVSV